MKFRPHIERSVVAWADQSGYPVEMVSDLDPWGKRTRDEEPWAYCSCRGRQGGQWIFATALLRSRLGNALVLGADARQKPAGRRRDQTRR